MALQEEGPGPEKSPSGQGCLPSVLAAAAAAVPAAAPLAFAMPWFHPGEELHARHSSAAVNAAHHVTAAAPAAAAEPYRAGRVCIVLGAGAGAAGWPPL